MAGKIKKYQKVVATSAAITLVASPVSPLVVAAAVTDVKGFTDVSERYKDAIQFLLDEGATIGKTGTRFGVVENITRQDAAVQLAKVLGLEVDESIAKTQFTDVPQRTAPYVQALVDAGITQGKTETRFGANDEISRVELAVWIQLGFGLTGSGEMPFTDVASQYVDAVSALYENKVTFGKTFDKFAAYDHATRGEYALFLYRASLIKLKGEASVTDDHKKEFKHAAFIDKENQKTNIQNEETKLVTDTQNQEGEVSITDDHKKDFKHAAFIDKENQETTIQNEETKPATDAQNQETKPVTDTQNEETKPATDTQNEETKPATDTQNEEIKPVTDTQKTEKDTEAPQLHYDGPTTMTVENGAEFTEPLVTATDNSDEEVTVNKVVKSAAGTVIDSIDTTQAGEYTITYHAEDDAGNVSEELVITVTVGEAKDTEAPQLHYDGSTTMTVENGAEFTEPLVTATDNSDEEVTVNKVVKSAAGTVIDSIDTTQAGEYTITYHAEDDAGNVSEELVITVTVGEAKDTEAPQLHYDGPTTIIVQNGKGFTEPLVTATDNSDAEVTVNKVIKNGAGAVIDSIDTNTEDEYTITYSAEDDAGNLSEDLVITVIVDTTAPQLLSATFVDADGDGEGEEGEKIELLFSENVAIADVNQLLSNFMFFSVVGSNSGSGSTATIEGSKVIITLGYGANIKPGYTSVNMATNVIEPLTDLSGNRVELAPINITITE